MLWDEHKKCLLRTVSLELQCSIVHLIIFIGTELCTFITLDREPLLCLEVENLNTN